MFKKEKAEHALLVCRDTRNWRMKLINDKWLNMNKKVGYRKMSKEYNSRTGKKISVNL